MAQGDGIDGCVHQKQRPVIRLTRRCDEVSRLGVGQHNTHISSMPPKGSSPRTLDLFEVTLTIPTPASEPAPATAKPSTLASLSDAQLAEQLSQLVEEVQRRLKKGKGDRPEVEAAARRTSLSLQRFAAGSARQDKASRSGKTSSPLQEGQRKAVRAALLAGVAPAQVAKHFGLSLAAVRKVLAEAA